MRARSFRHRSYVGAAAQGHDRRLRRARLRACSGRGGPSLTGRVRQRKNRGPHERRQDTMHEPMQVDTDLVRQLAEMLDENELTEIEVEDGGRRIVVKRKLAGARRAGRTPRPPPPPAAAAAAPRRGRSRAPPAIRARSNRRWSAPSISCRRARRAAVRRGRRHGQRRRHAADHRGDEGDEPDRRAARRHGQGRSWSRTASRSSSTSRWSIVE